MFDRLAIQTNSCSVFSDDQASTEVLSGMGGVAVAFVKLFLSQPSVAVVRVGHHATMFPVPALSVRFDRKVGPPAGSISKWQLGLNLIGNQPFFLQGIENVCDSELVFGTDHLAPDRTMDQALLKKLSLRTH